MSHERNFAATRSFDHPRFKADNWCCSLDGNSQNVEVIVLLEVLPMKAANTSVMHNIQKITFQLLYLQTQQLLMLG
jgi:hypothetical protein